MKNWILAYLAIAGLSWARPEIAHLLIHPVTALLEKTVQHLEKNCKDHAQRTPQSSPPTISHSLPPIPSLSSTPPITETIDGIEFVYATPAARSTYHCALEKIMDNLTPEYNACLRKERLRDIQELSFHPRFGIPDPATYNGVYVMDEKRARALLAYLEQTSPSRR